MTIFGKYDLTRKAKLWQRRLRLQDWDVKARFGPTNSPEQLGLCNFDLSNGWAEIVILEQQDDAEVTLVHELLHLHCARIKDNDDEMEHLINRIAKVLVEAYQR